MSKTVEHLINGVKIVEHMLESGEVVLRNLNAEIEMKIPQDVAEEINKYPFMKKVYLEEIAKSSPN